MIIISKIPNDLILKSISISLNNKKSIISQVEDAVCIMHYHQSKELIDDSILIFSFITLGEKIIYLDQTSGNINNILKIISGKNIYITSIILFGDRFSIKYCSYKTKLKLSKLDEYKNISFKSIFYFFKIIKPYIIKITGNNTLFLFKDSLSYLEKYILRTGK